MTADGATGLPGAAPASADLRGDLGRAWRVWVEQPGLPLCAAAVGVVVALGSSAGAVGASASLLSLLLLGWVGTERLWYLRAWQGGRLRPQELLPVTFRYLGRFLVLGALAGALYVLLALPALVVVVRRAADVGLSGAAAEQVDVSAVVPVWAAVWLLAALVALDVAGTFVTPALVYSTWRVREALVLGLRLLRRTWPHAGLYVVAPPLALVLVNQAVAPAWVLGVPAVVAAALLNLLVKGAVASLYLRAAPLTGPDGAVTPPAHPPRYPREP